MANGMVNRLLNIAEAARIGEVTPPAWIFENAAAEIERLDEAKRRALAIADERSKENCALRAALETQRWHIKTGDAQELLICVGDHAKDAPCDFHRYRYVVEQEGNTK